MCLDYDLFGDIIVTVKDVNLWLDLVPRLKGASNTRRNYYAEYGDIANKIKEYKKRGLFDNLINQQNAEAEYDDMPLKFLNTKYVCDNIKPPCPPQSHACDNPTCAIYIKKLKHKKAAERYAAQKKLKEKKLKEVNRFKLQSLNNPAHV